MFKSSSDSDFLMKFGYKKKLNFYFTGAYFKNRTEPPIS